MESPEILLNSLPDTTLQVSYQGQISAIYGSPDKQTKITSTSKDKHLDDVLPVFIAKGLIFNIKKAIDTQSLQVFEYIDTSSEGTQYFEARINSISLEECIISLRNITSFKITEKELLDQANDFKQEKRALEKYIDSNLQMENFAYIASHDLREPLRTMRTFGQFLDKRIRAEIDDKSRNYLDFIIDAADRMNQLIEDLLTYTRVNTEPFEREAINVANMLAQVTSGLHDEIKETDAQIIAQDLPATIYGSTNRIQQVFHNLIGNAVKFHKADEKPVIDISFQETPTHWQFSIKDDGIGISKDFFNDIFTVFKKLHGRQKYPGTGIGLALVKRIIGQHEGEIWVESEEGQGSTFHFTLLK